MVEFDPLTGDPLPKAAASDDAKEIVLAITTPLEATTAELALEDLGSLTNLAIDALEHILRHPGKYSKQVIGAANLVLQRKLGAVPDTVIQNNMQFIVKWQD